LIKVISNEQVRLIDKQTIERQGISSDDLMEKAAKACAERLLESFEPGISFAIFCGKGNNGGDGLAIARILWQRGKTVSVYIVEDTGTASADFQLNYQRLTELKKDLAVDVKTTEDIPTLEGTAVIVDALFGSGLNRVPSGMAAEIIQAINASTNPVVAIDIPSGLYGDKHTDDLSTVVRATTTLTFQVPRPVFFYPEYEQQTGEWQLLDIGLDVKAVLESPAYAFVPDNNDITSLLPYRPLFGHKGTFGHALLLAGSYGKAGAAILAARACLKSGAGLVTVRTPAKCVTPLQSALPEAMCIPDEEETFLSTIIKPATYVAIGAGPGLGIDKQTGNVIKRMLQDFDCPMVLDADALNILAENPTWLHFLPAGTILTPHIGEFSRLAGKIADPFERTKKQIEFSKKFNCYILLKGRFSALSCPDGQLFFNPTGNNGMAKGGSGDVLTGLITGLLAQGLSPMKAALCGAYIHGLAGDHCAKTSSPITMTANELIDFFEIAFNEVKK
jgi:hydroxyethylthiazole kinase-like uncharacterized protein yjeF